MEKWVSITTCATRTHRAIATAEPAHFQLHTERRRANHSLSWDDARSW